MKKISKYFKKFKRDCISGATAIEYALIASLVGVGLVAALGTLEDELTDSFTSVGESLADSTP